jgi:RNA polymerase sigma factor (sigma-70 family)
LVIVPNTEPLADPIGRARSVFEELYRSRYQASIRLAWLLTHSSQAAEDAVQEAFLALYRRFEEVDHPAAYLDRSIIFQCRSWVRRERIRRQRTESAVERWGETPLADSQLIAAVHRLPYRQRVVIVTRYWGDWTEAEIARALGCRPGTVKSLTSRALAQLRKEVGHAPDRL